MANARRGEVAVTINGREWILCLTLGALAEIENHFAVDDLTSLGEKLAAGRLALRDIIAIVHAAARGGGMSVGREDVASLSAENLPTLFEVVVKLFMLAFPAEPSVAPNPPSPQRAASPSGPFPGTP